MSEHVLIIEDEESYRDSLRVIFEREGFRVSLAATGRQGIDAFERDGADVVLLDLMLPEVSGTDVFRVIRARSAVPIIMVTARDDQIDKIIGLEMGADDYVTKPFSPRELLARVHAVLRRYQVQTTLPERDNSRRAFRFVGWELNLRTRRLRAPDGSSVELSNGEFSLLNALCRTPQRVLTRDQLLSMSRLHEAEVYDRTIDVQVRRLRLKMETDSAHPLLILTERGAGYRLACEVETLF